MTLFVLLATVMVAIAAAAVLWPLLRKPRGASVEHKASNIAIIRDQLAELDADLAAGAISAEQHQQARSELTRRVLEEGHETGAPLASSRRSGVLAIGLVVAIALAAVGVYALLGQPGAINQSAVTAAAGAPEPHISPEQMAGLADKLKEKLNRDPEHAEGWVMLGRTYYVLQRYPEAVQAYEQALPRMPDNADVLADYADALAAVQGRSLEGKPREMIERALKANPTQWKALALAGTAAFDRKDYQAAVDYWQQLKASLPPDSDMAKSADASIQEARDLGRIATIAGSAGAASNANAGKAVGANTQPSSATAVPAAPATSPVAANPATAVSGTVSLSPAMAAQVKPDDPVFIFARPAEGSRMPLAFMRKQVKDLPATFALDDAMAMAPAMKLSNYQDVIVGARISKTGDVMPHGGDLEGLSKPVKVGSSGIAVVIDSRLP